MTKDEAIAFVKHYAEMLAGAFAFQVPRYTVRWDKDAEIIMIDICCRDGSHARTYCLGWEDVSEEGLWHRIRAKLSIYQDIYPDWNVYRPSWRDIW
jgi:hypothetical protein